MCAPCPVFERRASGGVHQEHDIPHPSLEVVAVETLEVLLVAQHFDNFFRLLLSSLTEAGTRDDLEVVARPKTQ